MCSFVKKILKITVGFTFFKCAYNIAYIDKMFGIM